MAARSPWTLILTLPLAITIRYGVVAREEVDRNGAFTTPIGTTSRACADGCSEIELDGDRPSVARDYLCAKIPTPEEANDAVMTLRE